jgi:outer membrane protein OmpA-like peptidoglycan-associated protein
MKKILAVTLIAAALAGCQNNPMQDADGSTNKTAAYGGIGALVGAAAGALINHDNRGKGALIGAVTAGAAAAGYGYYADKQEAELRKQMEGSGVQVQRVGDDIKLVMPGAITFASGSDELSLEAAQSLNKLAGSLKQFPESKIEITGFTDNVGAEQMNLELSKKRAVSVGRYLVAQGVERSRIEAFGKGVQDPVASNATEQGRAQNRRVEIKLIAPPASPAQETQAPVSSAY